MDLTFSQKEKMKDMILIQFQRLNIAIPESIMTYSPIEKLNEFDPGPVTDFCLFKNPSARFVFPVMDPDLNKKKIRAILIKEDTGFSENQFNIYEPVNGIEIPAIEIDLVIVPLLCFDKSGNRVGYGKGYYDSFLNDCSKSCIKIGFCFFDPVEYIDDINEFDIPLDYCITPETIYTFTN